MSLRMVFGRDDLQRVRIAARPDPMWELVLSLHRARDRHVSARYLSWREQVRLRASRHDDVPAWLALLFGLVPARGDFPDFLTPAPLVTEPDAGLAELSGTPAYRLRTDLAAAFVDRSPPSWVRRLAGGERDQLDSLVAAVRGAHSLLIAPQWEEVRDVVRTDRAARMGVLAGEGVGAVLSGLPGVRSWDGTTLEVDYPRARTVHLSGRGVTFVPSFFCVGRPVTYIDPELPPILLYPAAGTGVGNAAGTDPTHLDALLSRTRAECLGALTTPRTTSALARAVGMSVATASKQATVLRQAGLVASVRDGGSMRHQVTELGVALLSGRMP